MGRRGVRAAGRTPPPFPSPLDGGVLTAVGKAWLPSTMGTVLGELLAGGGEGRGSVGGTGGGWAEASGAAVRAAERAPAPL